MRLMGILGLLIIFLILPIVLNWEIKPLPTREVKNSELFLFFIVVITFFIVNLLIAYSWWDPNHPLGMGPLFFPSILSLIILGLYPILIRKKYNLDDEEFFNSTENLKQISIIMIVIAFGYGLISVIWHCCSFFRPNIFFFYFIIKFFQLWGMCTFFFKYGFKLFLSITKPWIAYLIIAVLFGLCYPWHTWSYALTFMIFGFFLCYLTRKTDSYLPGLILLYFAYIFHAGLPWNGAIITFFVIYPISLCILGSLIYFNLKKD